MKLRVYNGEKFERNKRRYLFFSLVLILIIWLSLWKKNTVGVVVLFFILGAYFYYSIIANQVVSIEINEKEININQKKYPRSFFNGYVIEIEKKSQQIKNIVFITEKSHLIYTIHDKKDETKAFIMELNNHLPLLSEYNQWSLEKAARILKL